MVPYDKTKTFPQSLFLKYAKEMHQDNPEIAKNEWKLYPSEEKKFYLQKRFLLLTQDDGHSPCAMVRAGQGKVRIFHSLILHENDNFTSIGDLFAFGTCNAYGWGLCDTPKEIKNLLSFFH